MPDTDAYEISTDPARLEISFIHEFLRQSYWARNIPREVVERSIRHALCFGAFLQGRQVAFARAVTDRATFVYVADVFVDPAHRGRGVSKQLMRAILEHPDLQGVRRFLLATKDAHGLYQQFGFKPVPNPQDFLTIHFPDIYQKPD
jgi:GNAT superfamily N-acetyltransferase